MDMEEERNTNAAQRTGRERKDVGGRVKGKKTGREIDVLEAIIVADVEQRGGR